MGDYIIPANSKKSILKFGLFRTIDLIILGSGAFITLILLFAIDSDSIISMFIKLLPVGAAILLVFPLAYYHNVLVFLQEFFLYMSSQKEYRWRGWCCRYEFNEKQQS